MSIKSILKEKYSKTVWIENDGKCNELAEFWKENLSNMKNCIFMGLDTEMTGKIILEEKFYRGLFRSSGEFSSMLGYLKNPNNEERFEKIRKHKPPITYYSSDKYIDSHEFFENYQNCDMATQGIEGILKGKCYWNHQYPIHIERGKVLHRRQNPNS